MTDLYQIKYIPLHIHFIFSLTLQHFINFNTHFFLDDRFFVQINQLVDIQARILFLVLLDLFYVQQMLEEVQVYFGRDSFFINDVFEVVVFA
jgi:hypothetical protein